MSSIFISYRRELSAGHAGRLYDRLAGHFGEGEVFMDITMEPGLDFVEQIDAAVGSSSVFLAVIPKGWATVPDEEGKRRLEDPNDFVRLELEAALDRPTTRVIPLLVSGATMPRASELPETLVGLTRRHAHELSDTRWAFDVDRLIDLLDKLVGRDKVVEEETEAASVATNAPVETGQARWVSSESGRLKEAIGLETKGGIFTRLLEEGVHLPAGTSAVFTTAEDNQPSVELHVLQGASELAAFNRSLGKFQLVGIPPAPSGTPQIEVTFEVDVAGMLAVKARDLGTGNEQQVRIESGSDSANDLRT